MMRKKQTILRNVPWGVIDYFTLKKNTYDNEKKNTYDNEKKKSKVGTLLITIQS